MIQIFDRTDLQGNISFVSGLVARLDVQKYEIVRLQCIDRRLSLTFLIRIIQTCRSLHFNRGETRIDTDSLDQIDR